MKDDSVLQQGEMASWLRQIFYSTKCSSCYCYLLLVLISFALHHDILKGVEL